MGRPKKESTEQIQKPQALGIQTGTEAIREGGIPRTAHKVAIVGFAPSSMADAQIHFGDPDFEIWALNQLYLPFPAIAEYATRWWQIHHRHTFDTAVRDHKHGQWLAEWGRQTGRPIYMMRQEPDIPGSIAFPWEGIMQVFGRYFTNSISWEIALAIYEGFTDIYIYGVDMAQDSEYKEQRPSCEFFIGWARGAGINVYVPAKSDLLKAAYVYPIEESGPIRVKIDARRTELRQRANQLFEQEQGSRDTRMQVLGALENMNYIEKAWFDSARMSAVEQPK